MVQFKSAEQDFNSNVVRIFTQDGETVATTTNRLEQFILSNRMNIEMHGVGLICDPEAREYEVESKESKYLDDNFDLVCEKYLKSL